MANKEKISWQERISIFYKDVNTFLRRWMSLSMILALIVATLWYWNLVKVADDIQKTEKQQTENVSDTTKAPSNPNSTTDNTPTNLSSIASSRVNFNYSNEGDYSKYRDSRPLERLLNFFQSPAVWIICSLTAVLLFIFIMIHKKREFLKKRTKENDSEAFVVLLREFESEIKKLGTPRRVKRQINKLRFQYNLLENEKLLLQEQNQKFLFEISIKAELNHSIFDSFENLKTAQQESKYRQIDQKYLNRIYELNENVYAGDGVEKIS